MVNIESLKEKLRTIAQEKGTSYQLLLNKLGEERFLARLAQSRWTKSFIFKGGSLMPRLVETSRRTRDIDFAIQYLNNELTNLIKIVGEISSINLNDGFAFEPPSGQTMEHPRMPYTGARLKTDFKLAQMKGSVWMDLALGDELDPVAQTIHVLRYRKSPMVGEDFTLLTYPPEFLFSEKFQTAILLGAANSRMKDYYDLLKLVNSGKLNTGKLKIAIKRTFTRRNTPFSDQMAFSVDDIATLDQTWKDFIERENLNDTPKTIKEVVEYINQFLEKGLAD